MQMQMTTPPAPNQNIEINDDMETKNGSIYK